MDEGLIPSQTDLDIGQIANDLASQMAFQDLRSRRSVNTLIAHQKDMVLLSEYLHGKGVWVDNLDTSPVGWRKVTWGLVTGFRLWMLQRGYSINSINRALSTVRTYATKAFESGAIDEREHALIQTVKGYSHKESRHVDLKREESRRGAKKAKHVSLTSEQVQSLKKDHPNTPQGRRDRLLMCLLLDLGLRVGELAQLQVTDVETSKYTQIDFYRPKVSKDQILKLPPDLKAAMTAYFKRNDAPAVGCLLRESESSGELSDIGMTEDGIRKRVRELGKRLIDVVNLSPHDCRHNWATQFARKHNGNPFKVQEAGGWTSIATARRYIEDAKYANDGQDIWSADDD